MNYSDTYTFDLHVMSKTPSAAHLAQACAALWNDIQADPDYWTDTDEILNAYLVPLCELGTRTYGATEFGWALMDAGLDKDDAETCVDCNIPDRGDVYADNAHVWEMAFDRS